MNFFDMGPLEILLILVIALIIFGPGKIPDIARNLGRAVNALRKASFDLSSQIKQELEVSEKDQKSIANTNNKTEKQTDTKAEKPEDEKTVRPEDQ